MVDAGWYVGERVRVDEDEDEWRSNGSAHNFGDEALPLFDVHFESDPFALAFLLLR